MQAESVQLVVRKAESITDPPTVIEVADSVVVSLGCAGLTASGSQTLVAATFFASPLYFAWKLKVPVKLNMTGLLLGTTPLVTVTTDTIEAAAPQFPTP
jgi:hypothetical protein